MIQRQLIEKILRKFPGRKEAEIRAELNTVKREFCRETRIIEGEFTTFNTDATSVYYTIGDDIVTIKQVDVNGVKITPLAGVYEIVLQA